MVGHQTICIENAARRQWLTRYLVSWTDLLIKHRDEMSVVFFIIENILPVYTSNHHMIDTCSAGFSWTTCHIISLIFHKGKKYIAKHQIIQQQNRTRGQTPCAMIILERKRKPRKEYSKRGLLLYYRTRGLSPCVTCVMLYYRTRGLSPCVISLSSVDHQHYNHFE